MGRVFQECGKKHLEHQEYDNNELVHVGDIWSFGVVTFTFTFHFPSSGFNLPQFGLLPFQFNSYK